MLLINTGVGDKLVNERTKELLLEEPDNSGYVPPVRVGQAVKWSGKLLSQLRSHLYSCWMATCHRSELAKLSSGQVSSCHSLGPSVQLLEVSDNWSYVPPVRAGCYSLGLTVYLILSHSNTLGELTKTSQSFSLP